MSALLKLENQYQKGENNLCNLFEGVILPKLYLTKQTPDFNEEIILLLHTKRP